MRYVYIMVVAIIVLLLQNALSKRRQGAFVFVLPCLTMVLGIVYEVVFLEKIKLSGMVPFIFLSVYLLVLGFIQRDENRKKELERMRSKDL